MSELIALRQLTLELIASPEISQTAKINLGFADFALSSAILAQYQEHEKTKQSPTIPQ